MPASATGLSYKDAIIELKGFLDVLRVIFFTMRGFYVLAAFSC